MGKTNRPQMRGGEMGGVSDQEKHGYQRGNGTTMEALWLNLGVLKQSLGADTSPEPSQHLRIRAVSGSQLATTNSRGRSHLPQGFEMEWVLE